MNKWRIEAVIKDIRQQFDPEAQRKMYTCYQSNYSDTRYRLRAPNFQQLLIDCAVWQPLPFSIEMLSSQGPINNQSAALHKETHTRPIQSENTDR